MKHTIHFVLLIFWALQVKAQKAELIVPVGHTMGLTSVHYSPDGRFIISGSKEGAVKVWTTAGKEIQTIASDSSSIVSVAFSPDGKYALIAKNNKASLWEWMQGKLIKTFSGDENALVSACFSPDGSRILTGSVDGTVKVWDRNSGREIQSFKVESERGLKSAAFSPDGKNILTLSDPSVCLLWDATSGKQIRQLAEEASYALFAPDGKSVLLGEPFRLIDVNTGNEIRTIDRLRSGHGFNALTFSADGKYLLAGHEEFSLRTGLESCHASLWDVQTGEEIRIFKHDRSVNAVAFSPDGKFVLTGSEDRTVKQWITETGELVSTLSGHAQPITAVAYSTDGAEVLIAGNASAKLWSLNSQKIQSIQPQYYINDAALSSVASGTQILLGGGNYQAELFDRTGAAKGFVGRSKLGTSNPFSTGNDPGNRNNGFSISDDESITAVAFSPDGNLVLLGFNVDYAVALWDRSTGQEKFRIQHNSPVTNVAFLPDGKRILTSSSSEDIISDLNGKEIETSSERMEKIFNSPDGKHVVTASSDGVVKFLGQDARLLRTIKAHTSYISKVSFSPDGKYFLTGSGDNTAKIWNTASGELCATLICVDNNDWVVTAPSGLFDASAGAMSLMYFKVDGVAVGLDQLKARYYEPYLLQKIMGFMPGGLRPVEELNDVPLYPEVLEASIKDDRLKVRLFTRSGGIGKVALELDGFELVADANPGRQNNFELDLKPYLDYFSPTKPNHLSLKLYNDKGWLESQPYTLQHSYDGVSSRGPGDPPARRSLNPQGDASLEKIHFYALVVGTSKYRDEKLNLKYPEKDAAIFADALRKAGGKLFKDRIEVKLISTETEPWPRKAEIRKALKGIAAKAGPDDILLVYFSGHGVTYPPVSEAGQFYYLTTDIAGDKLKDEAILKTQAVAQDSLMEWIRQIKARKRILIYDACNSGSVVNQLEAGAKDLNTDQRRALERMKDRTGMYVLAGSAADKSSYEASNYGHGLLTYSLINGMLSVAAKMNQLVEVGDLFAFVEDDVERLAKNINREQRPEVIKAESYPIGIIDNQTDIKMPAELPVFVRVNLMDSKKNKDLLGLSKTFNAELERISSEKTPAMVFWDVESYAGKYYYIGGQYQSVDGKVTGNASLYLNDTELKQFPINGSADALGKLAKDLIFEVQDYLAKNPGK